MSCDLEKEYRGTGDVQVRGIGCEVCSGSVVEGVVVEGEREMREFNAGLIRSWCEFEFQPRTTTVVCFGPDEVLRSVYM